MTVLSTTRKRLVVFRLTEDEYASLKDACLEKGGRNLSEFTRSELLTVIQSDSSAVVIQQRLSALESRLADMQGLVERISEGLDRMSVARPSFET